MIGFEPMAISSHLGWLLLLILSTCGHTIGRIRYTGESESESLFQLGISGRGGRVAVFSHANGSGLRKIFFRSLAIEVMSCVWNGGKS
ncbi:hypothetical protein ACVF5D_001056 [Vibrio vulnificus]